MTAAGMRRPRVPPTNSQAGIGPPLPQLQIPLAGVPIGVATSPGGDKALIVGPCLVQFVVPLTADGAREIAAVLETGIMVAQPGDVAGL